MNDQHITAIATIVQDILLVLNALLIAWYLYETRKIRRAAQEQAESASRPAIVVKNSDGTLSAPMLENIGNGPAIEVEWSLPNSSFAGVISYMRPNTHEILPMEDIKPVYEAGSQVSPNAASIECSYRSLAGWEYSSSNAYDENRGRYSTTFSPKVRS